MYEIEERTLDVNGFNIAYTDTGPKDGRVLFCVHGLLSNGRDYDFLALRLADQGYRTIAIDLPGRGKSVRFGDDSLYSLPSYVPFCHALINHVTSGKSFDWLGVSLGGMLAMAMCNAEGLSVSRLILVDVGAEIPGDALNMVAQLAKVQPIYHNRQAAVMALHKRCASWGITDCEIWAHLENHNIVQNTDGTYSFHYDSGIGRALPNMNETIQFWDIWAQIKQPVLLVRGGISMLLPVEIAFKMREQYAGKSFDQITFESCGHVPNLMQDDHIDAIAKWLGP